MDKETPNDASRIQSGEPNARGPISYLIPAFPATPGPPHRHRIPSPEGENPGSVFRFRRHVWATMTTGHVAACRHARTTGPTAGGPSLAGRSAYLAIPRTSSSAPADWSISARAGEPSTSSDDRQPGGKARLASSSTTASHALLAAWSSSGRGVPEKPEYGARSDRALSWTKRRCTSACRSRPSRAAHRTAAAEASVPSTPTTIRPRVVSMSGQTFSLDRCSLTSSGRINGIPRRAAMSRPQAADVITVSQARTVRTSTPACRAVLGGHHPCQGDPASIGPRAVHGHGLVPGSHSVREAAHPPSARTLWAPKHMSSPPGG